MNNKKIYIILGIFAIIFTFFGGSLAYWQWETNSEQQTAVTFTVTKDFECAADGGGNITSNDVTLAPASCTNSAYAIQREIKVMPTIYNTNFSVYMDLWLELNSGMSPGLKFSNNFKYALTTESDSCTEGVISTGNFSGKIGGDKVDLLGELYENTVIDTYYLYIWLDAAETDQSTMDQVFDFSLNGSCTNMPIEPFFSVYSTDDNSLRFYSGKGNDISVGEFYNDKLVSAIYMGLENDEYNAGEAPWYEYQDSITTVVIEDEVSPMSTAYWFQNLENVEYLDVSKLNTSSVTNMESMFYQFGKNATKVDLSSLSNWDVSNVTDMRDMFGSAGSNSETFELDLSNWDVSSVINMNGMFAAAGKSAGSIDLSSLSNWDVSSVTNMDSMFSNTLHNATSIDLSPLSNWDVSSVTTMNYMFSYAGYNATTLDLSFLNNWDVSNVTTMNNMFKYAGYNSETFELDLSNWDVSSVTSMGYMFDHAGYSAASIDLSFFNNWDVSSVTSMSGMFSYAGYNATTLDLSSLSNWDVSSVTDMSDMFQYIGFSATTFSLNLSSWDVSSVTDMSDMFKYAGFNSETFELDLSNWDASDVMRMNYMFQCAGFNSETLKLNLSGWNTSSVKYMNEMFKQAGQNSTTWSIGDISNWDVSKVINMNNMFRYAGYYATYSLDLSGWVVTNVTSYTDFNKGVTSKITPPVWVN